MFYTIVLVFLNIKQIGNFSFARILRGDSTLNLIFLDL